MITGVPALKAEPRASRTQVYVEFPLGQSVQSSYLVCDVEQIKKRIVLL
jgi:hypothetical protein